MNLEGKLQANMVLWYRNDWYKLPKNLWATFNEGQNANMKQSLGLIPGVSDLLYLEPRGIGHGRGLMGIEVKYPGERHKVAHVIRQAKWILEVPGIGGFCDSLEMFREIIRGDHNGIDPRSVILYLEKLKTTEFVWDSSKFTIL